MKTRTRITAGSLAALASLLLAPASANVGYFAGSGQDIVLASTAEVQMVSEDVSIVVRPEGATYVCRFELRNLAEAAVEIQAGFPLDGVQFDGYPHWSESHHGDDCKTPATELVAARYRFVARDDAVTYHVRYARHDAEQKFEHLFLWTMHFAPQETRTLHVSYDVPISQSLAPTGTSGWTGMASRTASDDSAASDGGDEVPPYDMEMAWLDMGLLKWSSYVTETGGSWAGPIERADFHVRTHLADAALRQELGTAFFQRMPDPLGEDGDTPEPVRGRTVVWFHLDPKGWTQTRRHADFGDEWFPVENSWDLHVEPFEPGPPISVAWMGLALPADIDGLRALLAPEESGSPLTTVRALTALRAAVAAWHGVQPEDTNLRARLSSLAWYEPVAGRKEADLPADVGAQLALIDEHLAKAGSAPAGDR